MKIITAIDVCAGAGGWACAARGLPIKILSAFDREQDALDTYGINHPGVECINCDVTTQDFSRWAGVDLILGGIPCEQLSVIRNNTPRTRAEMRGFKALLKRFLSLPEELGAAHWCYEEVIQVRHHLPRRTPFIIINSQAFSAQARIRAYLTNIPSPALPSIPDGRLLQNHLRAGPHRLGPRIHNKRRPAISGKSSKTFQPFYPDRKSKTIINLSSRRDAEIATTHMFGWRQLEWQECAALQGFPEDYLFIGCPSRVSKMIGQAVQIDTGRAILQSLLMVKEVSANIE
jgi:site-specific DNA-cytosine methylase